jgi:hypothetical protein
LKDIAVIIKWLDASRDFDEEVLRLNNKKIFLDKEDSMYFHEILKFCYSLCMYLNKEWKNILGKYTKNVDMYLEKDKERHYNKEDIIY